MSDSCTYAILIEWIGYANSIRTSKMKRCLNSFRHPGELEELGTFKEIPMAWFPSVAKLAGRLPTALENIFSGGN